MGGCRGGVELLRSSTRKMEGLACFRIMTEEGAAAATGGDLTTPSAIGVAGWLPNVAVQDGPRLEAGFRPAVPRRQRRHVMMHS